jgi:hypothetical protein
MTVERLSNAGSLRVIGQHLTGLGASSFEVGKRGEEFIVRMSTDKSGERTFLKSLFKTNQRSLDAATQTPNPIRFSTSQIIQSDTDNRLNRLLPTAMPDANNLSTMLRVLGDYLDRKASGDFDISCDTELVTVNYNEKIENFRVEGLYDLGVHMYLRRSNRCRAT